MSIWRPYYVLVDGEPLRVSDVRAWAHWFETADRSVACTDVGPGRVSTVFLGIDHNYFSGPPVLWETMIFDVPGVECRQWRYTSRAAAVAGHAEAVDMARMAVQVNEVHRV
jgi:hypothetical protein